MSRVLLASVWLDLSLFYACVIVSLASIVCLMSIELVITFHCTAASR